MESSAITNWAESLISPSCWGLEATSPHYVNYPSVPLLWYLSQQPSPTGLEDRIWVLFFEIPLLNAPLDPGVYI